MTFFSDGVEVDRFQKVVERRLGLRFDSTRLASLAEALERRLEQTGEHASTYLDRIEGAGLSREEAAALAAALTVPETYFFRNIEQFRAFSEVALPARTRGRSPIRRLRLLSAGCASGDEAYSMGILVRDLPGLTGWEVSIDAVDLSAAAIERAVQARYSPWSLRETPADLLSRWFRPDGRNFELDPMVRAMVSFRVGNLVDDDAMLWRPATFDVVFCRNVIMYLTAEAARRVVEHLTRSLAPGGFLYLGHAETLRGLSRDFHLRHTHGTFYYQRRGGGDDPRFDEDEAAPISREEARAPADAAVTAGDSWVENIRRASERVQSLTRTSPSGRDLPAAEAAATGGRSRAELVVAVDLLRSERYAEAQATLDRLPEESARDPDALLLKAVLLTHGGDLAMAQQACRDLLAQDEMNAGAHYLMALCREGTGAAQSAAEHDRRAAYLDPTFAMPRLHIGLLARRAGDLGSARQELEHALALLQHEEASRVLLFGGGFSRDALVALCRAELGRCGGGR